MNRRTFLGLLAAAPVAGLRSTAALQPDRSTVVLMRWQQDRLLDLLINPPLVVSRRGRIEQLRVYEGQIVELLGAQNELLTDMEWRG